MVFGRVAHYLVMGRLVLLGVPVLTGAAMLSAGPAPVTFSYIPVKLSAADRTEVGELYAVQCAGCHGEKGEGNNNGLSLFGSKDPLASAASIHFGRAEPPPLKTVMPAYGAQSMLSQKQISQLATYIAEFRPPWP